MVVYASVGEEKVDREEKVRKAYSEEYAKLYELLDRDPKEALEGAFNLRPSEYLDELNVASLRACVFVDAGQELADAKMVRQGVRIFRRIEGEEPDRPEDAYNLANALSSLARLTKLKDRPWLLSTSGLRRAARNLFQKAAESDNRSLRTQARTNQANLLLQSYRWVEAYDHYWESLLHDPWNGIAHYGMARILLRRCRVDSHLEEPYRELAGEYLRKAASPRSHTRRYGGEKAVRAVQELIEQKFGGKLPDMPLSREVEDPYIRFCADTKLLLALDITGRQTHDRRCDSLAIQSVVEDIDTPFGVPPIFAMFNMLKADFVAARWMTYIARDRLAPETGYYSATLDYANYGIAQALLLNAQRSAIDILDRVAVAASEHFDLPGDPGKIYFHNRWHIKDSGRLRRPLEWLPLINEEIQSGDAALIALSELAEDVMKGGYLNPQKSLRNESTHRFVVLHEMGDRGSRDSRYIKHFSEMDFLDETLQALRVARAAIFYLHDAIAIHETRLEAEAEGPLSFLDVPPHHWIQGED